MGAFVGVVTSPFLRRRKGRIGKAFTVQRNQIGVGINDAVSPIACNSLGILLVPITDTNGIQRSDNYGITWTNENLGAGPGPNENWIRCRNIYGLNNEKFILTGNVFAFLTWWIGSADSLGFGRLYKNEQQGPDATGLTTENAVWALDGKLFAIGMKDRIFAAKPGDTLANVIQTIIPQGPQSYFLSGCALDDGSFIFAGTNTAPLGNSPLVKIYYDYPTQSIKFSIPTGNFPDTWVNGLVAIGNLVVGIGKAQGGDTFCLRSVDYGNSFVEVATPVNVDMYSIFRHNGKIIACGEGKIIQSYAGLNWTESLDFPVTVGDRIFSACQTPDGPYLIIKKAVDNFKYPLKLHLPAEI